jgi:hypothetical protein
MKSCLIAIIVLLTSFFGQAAYSDSSPLLSSQAPTLQNLLIWSDPSLLRYSGATELIASKITAGGPKIGLTEGHRGLQLVFAADEERIDWPERPRFVALTDEASNILGALTELQPNTGVLVTALHVLAGLPIDLLKSALEKHKLDLDQYRFFVLRKNGKLLDVVFAVPQARINEIFIQTESNERRRRALRIRPSPIYAPYPALRSKYISYQLGTVANSSVYQVSWGIIPVLAMNHDHFFLPFIDENRTTSRSSGAPVFLPTQFGSADLGIGGFIECVAQPGLTKSHVPTSGGIRVISAEALLAAEVHSITLDKLENMRPEVKKDCTPIDARYGGGL